MPPARSRSTPDSTIEDETWKTQEQIRTCLGVGPYACSGWRCGPGFDQDRPVSAETWSPFDDLLPRGRREGGVCPGQRQATGRHPGMAENQDARPPGRRARFEELKQTRPPGTALGK